MRIAMLGFGGVNGMLTHLAKALRKKGHEVYFRPTVDYALHYCTRRIGQPNYIPLQNYLMGLPIPLSAVYEEFEGVDFLDVILVEQANLIFKNDVSKETIVAYYHRDLPGTFNVHLPDILLYRFMEVPLFLEVYHRHAWYSTKLKYKLYNGINPTLYKSNKKKRFKGIVWMGTYRPLEWYMKKDVIQHDYYENTYRIKEWAKEHGVLNCMEHHTNKCPFSFYKHVMERSEAYLIMPGRNAYVTRIAYEAAICNTIIVLWVQNEHAKEAYREWGLIDEVNCLMFENVEELHEIKEVIDSELEFKEELRKNAHDWVIKNHTYEIRADQFLALMEKVKIYQKREKERQQQELKIKKVELKNV